MYINVPAANEDVTMTSISLSKPYSRSPDRIPSGVPDANKTINKLPLPISYLSKFLRIDIPSDREAAVLWMNRPTMILNDADESFISPKAMPSKNAWVARASRRISDCKPLPRLKQIFLAFLFVFSSTTLLIIPTSDPLWELVSSLKSWRWDSRGLKDLADLDTKLSLRLSLRSRSLVCWLITF